MGGDTLFANQHAALDAMLAAMRKPLEGRMAIHSAKRAYAPEGQYGAKDKGRSMDIRPSREAEATQPCSPGARLVRLGERLDGGGACRCRDRRVMPGRQFRAELKHAAVRGSSQHGEAAPAALASYPCAGACSRHAW